MTCPTCGANPTHARTGYVCVQHVAYASERGPTERVTCHACGHSFEYARCVLCNGYGVADEDTDAARKLLGMIAEESEAEKRLVRRGRCVAHGHWPRSFQDAIRVGIPNAGYTGLRRDTLIRAALVVGIDPDAIRLASGLVYLPEVPQ